jgi:hypothetical protein
MRLDGSNIAPADIGIQSGPRLVDHDCQNCWWGGWGSNLRPADYEKCGPVHRTHYLHGCHGVLPPMALIAPIARVTRSTNRSTPHQGDRRMPATERYRQQGLDIPGLRQAGDVVDLDYPPFFIDRVEDAIPPGPQTPADPPTRKGTTPAAAAHPPADRQCPRAQRHRRDRRGGNPPPDLEPESPN